MAMRLQEIHPALVHYPIALLPTAVGADALGRLTGSRTLMSIGKTLIGLAAGGAALAGAAGLLAQESSRFDEESQDILVTHRNLNLGLVGLTFWMTARRLSRPEPSLRYLAAGAAGIGVMAYSAYLGGHMVYEHGVGVKEAGGLREGEAPELLPQNAAETLELSRQHLERGLRHAVEDIAQGELVPWLTRARGTRPAEAEAPAFPTPHEV